MAQSKKYYWLKLNEHFFSQVTIKYLRKLPQGDTVVIVYLKLLLVSLKSNGVIYLRGIYSSIEDEVALLIDEDVMAVRLTLQALNKINLIEQGTEEGVIQMTDFQEMVGSESDSAVRMRNHRARKELAEKKQAALPDKTQVSQCDAEVTGGYARMAGRDSPVISGDIEIEIEKEIESEKKIEKETESDVEIDPAAKSDKEKKSEGRKSGHSKQHGPYGVNENVNLSDAEYDSLKKLYPDYLVKIDYFSSYMATTGKKYNNHYHTILQWAKKDELKRPQAAGKKKAFEDYSFEEGESF